MNWSWLKHPLALATLGPLLATLVIWIFGLLPSFLLWMKALGVGLYVWLASDHALPGWAWLLFGLFAAFGLFVVGAYAVSAMKQDPTPVHLSLTELHHRGVTWRWRWANKVGIESLVAFCPTCGRVLVWFYDPLDFGTSSQLVCEGCPSNRRSGRNSHIREGKVIADFPKDRYEIENEVKL